MNSQVLIGSMAVSGAGLLLWWSLFSDRRGGRAKAALKGLAANFNEQSFRDLSLAPSASERVFMPARDSLLRRVRRLTPTGSIESMQRRINLAGMQETWTVERLLSAKLLLTIAVFMFCILLAIVNGSAIYLGAAIVLGIASYLVPDGLLDARADRRQADIQDDMPDVIDQIMITVQAGLSFDGALDRVAGSNSGPFSEELQRVIQDIRLGLARSKSLERLAERTDVAEIDEFVVAMNQAEAYGLSVSNVLRVQAEDLRERRKQRAEERAHKMAVKLAIPLIFCIFPTIFIAALGPAVIRTINFDFGG